MNNETQWRGQIKQGEIEMNRWDDYQEPKFSYPGMITPQQEIATLKDKLHLTEQQLKVAREYMEDIASRILVEPDFCAVCCEQTCDEDCPRKLARETLAKLNRLEKREESNGR